MQTCLRRMRISRKLGARCEDQADCPQHRCAQKDKVWPARQSSPSAGKMSFVIFGALLALCNFRKLTELVSFPDTPRGARFRSPVPMYRCSLCRSMLASFEETE